MSLVTGLQVGLHEHKRNIIRLRRPLRDVILVAVPLFITIDHIPTTQLQPRLRYPLQLPPREIEEMMAVGSHEHNLKAVIHLPLMRLSMPCTICHHPANHVLKRSTQWVLLLEPCNMVETPMDMMHIKINGAIEAN